MFWNPPCRPLLATLIVSKFIGDVVAQGTCDCGCCSAAGRPASAQVNGQTTVCSVAADGEADSDQSSSSCPSQCTATAENSVVTNSQEGSIDTSRFCSMNCLPEKNEIGSSCRKLTDQEQAQLLTSGGNGEDPASLFMPTVTPEPAQLEDPNAPPEPPQLLDQQALAAMLNAAPSPANVDQLLAQDKKNGQESKETGALVAQASGRNAMASGIAARVADAEALSATGRSYADSDLQKSKGEGLLVIAAQAQAQAAEVRAAIYAKSAQKAAARAQADLKEIQEIPQKAAAYAAEEAKRECCGELQELANNKAIVMARLAPPAMPVPLAEAAVRAAQPYYNVMQKALSMGGLYEQSARNLQDQAQTLQEQSRTIAAQAVAYQGAGYGDMAAKLMSQAKAMLSEANTKNEQAKKDFAVAEGVRKQVPVYQANAAAASARATAIANPAGQPPPAIAPASLVQRSSFLHK